MSKLELKDLEEIRDQKKAQGVQAAEGVLNLIAFLEARLDPSELVSFFDHLDTMLSGRAYLADKYAEEYELDAYGVELANLNGELDR